MSGTVYIPGINISSLGVITTALPTDYLLINYTYTIPSSGQQVQTTGRIQVQNFISTAGAGGLTLSALTALIASLPTSLPTTAGVLWLNGNILQIS